MTERISYLIQSRVTTSIKFKNDESEPHQPKLSKRMFQISRFSPHGIIFLCVFDYDSYWAHYIRFICSLYFLQWIVISRQNNPVFSTYPHWNLTWQILLLSYNVLMSLFSQSDRQPCLYCSIHGHAFLILNGETFS